MVMDEILQELKTLFSSPEEVLLWEESARAEFAGDKHPARVLPDVVVRARSRGDVVTLLKWADARNIPVTPRSAGTGKVGSSVPVQKGILLDLTRMNKILAVDPVEMTARVEPGVINRVLKEAASQHGLTYPPDPASDDESTLGGNAGANAGGLSCVKYGVTRDYVLACEAVLMGGEVIHCGSRTRKHAVGYNLAQLLVGSEGTLAVITELTLRLVPEPTERRTLLAEFADEKSACGGVLAVTKKGITPRALELLDRRVSSLVRGEADLSALSKNETALLLVECDGFDQQTVANEIESSARALKEAGAVAVLLAGSEEEAQKLWDVRCAVSEALKQIAPGKLNEDVCVPRSKLPDLFAAIQKLSKEYDLPIPTFGHAGDGNVHVNVMYNGAQEKTRAERAVKELFRITLDLGGTLSGEHGIGIAKRPYIAMEIGPVELELMRRIKSAFDPKNLLNPGKILPEA